MFALVQVIAALYGLYPVLFRPPRTIFDHSNLRALIFKHLSDFKVPSYKCATRKCPNKIADSTINHYKDNMKGDALREFYERLENNEVCCDACTSINLLECSHYGPLGTCARFRRIEAFNCCRWEHFDSDHCVCGQSHGVDEDAIEGVWLDGGMSCYICPHRHSCFYPPDYLLESEQFKQEWWFFQTYHPSRYSS